MAKVKNLKTLKSKYNNTCVYVKNIDEEGNFIIDSNTSQSQVDYVKFTKSTLLSFHNRRINKHMTIMQRDEYEHKVLKLLQQHNIPYEQDYHFENEGYTLCWYVDDQWSGTKVTAELDCFGYLIVRTFNDSPEQCGGHRDIHLYKHGKSYDLSNIADVWSYFVFENRVYLIEADEYMSNRVTITEMDSNGSSEDRVYPSVPSNILRELNFNSLQALGASMVLSGLLMNSNPKPTALDKMFEDVNK